MTEFWENHLNVPADGDASFTHRTSLRRRDPQARASAASRSCCTAAITHPAMLIYLDNALSTSDAPQREPRPRAAGAAHRRPRQPRRGRRQELRADPDRVDGRHVATPGRRRTSPSTTGTGAVQVLDFERRQRRRRTGGTSPGATSAIWPTTRRRPRRIARKLAVKFVRDDPSDDLVERPGGGLPAVRAPRSSRCCGHWSGPPVFAASVDAKVRDPGEDLVATYRALGVTGGAGPRNEQDAANSMLWQTSSLGSASVLLAPSGRAARRQRVVVVAVAGAGVAADPLRHERQLVAHEDRDHLPQADVVGARASRALRPRWSTTCRGSCSTVGRRRALLDACCVGRRAAGRGERITRDHRGDAVAMNRACSPPSSTPPTSSPGDRHDLTARPARPGCCAEYAALSRRGPAGRRRPPWPARRTMIGSAVVRASAATTVPARAVMVVLSLRGAADGMSLVVPHADPVYYSARPRHRRSPRTGCSPATPCSACTRRSRRCCRCGTPARLAAVHATGLPAPNRSHFAAMEEVEDADPGSSVRVGWLNRLIGTGRRGTSPLQAFSVGGGCPADLALRAGRLHLGRRRRVDDDRRRPTNADPEAWRTAPLPAADVERPELGDGQGDAGHPPGGRRTSSRCTRPARQPANGAAYPDSDLGRAMAEVARIIRGDVGVEVLTVDQGDWDHHSGLGTRRSSGRMLRNAGELAAIDRRVLHRPRDARPTR